MDDVASTTTANLLIDDIIKYGADVFHYPITQKRLDRIRGTPDYDRVLRVLDEHGIYHPVHSAKPTGA